MPKHVQARAAQNEQEERQVRKLARSYHTPADWKFHAQMVIESWAGKTPNEIASELDCHPKTVRVHLVRFNTQGIEGLGMRAGSGRKPRLTEQERSKILGLVKQPPPGRLERCADGTLDAPMSKDQPRRAWMPLPRLLKKRAFRSNAARSGGSTPARVYAGVRLTGGEAAMTEILSAIRTAVVTHYIEPPAGSTTVCTDELGPVIPRTLKMYQRVQRPI